jgi:hypothetical protein
MFRRVIDLMCEETAISRAESTVHVRDARISDLIKTKQIGIGQLFTFLKVVPEFELLSFGVVEASFWREYRLDSPGICCIIKETYPEWIFDIERVVGGRIV